LDDDLASRRHGVAGIHRQVHDYLLHLPGIGAHAGRQRVQAQAELDVLPDQAAQ